jgi:galactokinase
VGEVRVGARWTYCIFKGQGSAVAHLKDALYQMVGDKNYEWKKHELRKTHDSVIRVMKHLIKEYDLNLDTIKAFNTRHVLSNLSYLRNSTRKNSGKKSRTRKGRKSLL